jgi:hypothetical protein
MIGRTRRNAMSPETIRPASNPLRLVVLALVALMVLTRFGHFGELSRLPDASWAVFFLGGLLLRDARVFAAFFGLAWLIDLGSFASGTPVDCFSFAYLFLVPAYGALWFAGRRAASWLQAAGAPVGESWRPAAVVALSFAIVAGVTAAFVVSNAGFWAYGSGFSPMGAAEYASRVAGYLPGYLLATSIYVALGLGARAVASRLFGEAKAGA